MLFDTIEKRLGEMPEQPLLSADHGPCMNCSFANEHLVPFYRWLFTVLDRATYGRLDQALIRLAGITGYDRFLPDYNLPEADFADTRKNAFWCHKKEIFLAGLREALAG